MPGADLERSFPGLQGGGYRITSPATAVYNCAAWAAGETRRWWDPSSEDGYYWPTNAPAEQSVAAFVAAFGALGYEPCADASLEPGMEKLAVYAEAHGWPTHVARQLPTGDWTSKLGASEDIYHSTPQALEGVLYGKVVQYLCRRSRRLSEAATEENH
jgi:hypothetical protein